MQRRDPFERPPCLHSENVGVHGNGTTASTAKNAKYGGRRVNATKTER